MRNLAMEWIDLERQCIKSVYYTDEKAQFGNYMEAYDVHHLLYGAILFELESDLWVRIENDIERNGITAYRSDASFVQQFKKINLKTDKIWSRVSDKTLKSIKLYPGHYIIGKPGGKTSRKDLKKEIISSIELVFQHEVSVFISAAEFSTENTIEPSLFDFMLYNKREIGIIHGLLPK